MDQTAKIGQGDRYKKYSSENIKKDYQCSFTIQNCISNDHVSDNRSSIVPIDLFVKERKVLPEGMVGLFNWKALLSVERSIAANERL